MIVHDVVSSTADAIGDHASNDYYGYGNDYEHYGYGNAQYPTDGEHSCLAPDEAVTLPIHGWETCCLGLTMHARAPCRQTLPVQQL